MIRWIGTDVRLRNRVIFAGGAVVLFALAFQTLAPITGSEATARRTSRVQAGDEEYWEVSKYSRIRVRRNGSVRTLAFVRDSGEEAYESQIDMKAPYELRFDYLKSLYLSYGFVPKPKRVLIVGLGGGAMVHFFAKYDPEVHVDVVEIDESIVRIAEKYFDVKPGKNGESPDIIVDDGVAFIARAKEKYDVIYMDAFLKPSATTDPTGVPIEQRTRQFYQSIQKALTHDGVVAFNINAHDQMSEDVAGIREAFPQAYAFSLPNGTGKVVIGSMASKRIPRSVLAKNLSEADSRLRAHYSLKARLNSLDP